MPAEQPEQELNVEALLRTLVGERCKIRARGGIAIAVQGVAHVTTDLGVVYERSVENIERLVAALAPYEPKLNVQGEPRGVRFLFDRKTISAGGAFSLRTTLGDIDLLHQIDGLGAYDAVAQQTEAQAVFGRTVQVLSLSGLLQAKVAAGRPKDLTVVPEIRAALEMRSQLLLPEQQAGCTGGKNAAASAGNVLIDRVDKVP
jgi:hypothetical protein